MKGCPSPPQIVRWRWPKNVRVRTAEIQTVSNKSYRPGASIATAPALMPSTPIRKLIDPIYSDI